MNEWFYYVCETRMQLGTKGVLGSEAPLAPNPQQREVVRYSG